MLTKIALSVKDATSRVHVGSIVAVSHRWEKPDEPDTNGDQLRCIQGFLREHPKALHVWYECVPRRWTPPIAHVSILPRADPAGLIMSSCECRAQLHVHSTEAYLGRCTLELSSADLRQDVAVRQLAVLVRKRTRNCRSELHFSLVRPRKQSAPASFPTWSDACVTGVWTDSCA